MERRRKSNSDIGTFWDHLEILRRKILVTAVLIGLIAVIFFILGDRVLAELLRYPREMGIEVVYLRPQEKFVAYLRMVTMCAVICGVPLAIIETASFIVPGLHRGERRVFIP
ncbi:MAG: twin-arginine translocase subunit TatC, partial [Sediminispirochaetaceae bacterium]